MLNQIIMGLPMWVWILLGCVISLGFTSQYENFNQMPNISIYNFNTRWCGWSLRFQPEWDKFTKYAHEYIPRLQVFDIKCDDSNNKALCNKYEIPGYPWVLLKINDTIKPYNGSRTSIALGEFVKNEIAQLKIKMI
jgi:hypothetical protein